MMRCDHQRGYTLIELVLTIVIMGAALLSLVALFSSLGVRGAVVEHRRVAKMLAEEQMEETRTRRFDENLTKDLNGNWSTVLGTESDESVSDKATFDDVDDFSGWSESLSSPFSGFSRSVSVSYVAEGDLNTSLTIPGSVPANWTPNYKRIQVTCSSSITTVQLVSLAGPVSTGD